MTEYAVLVALVALALIAVVGFFGQEVLALFQNAADEVTNVTPAE